MHPFARYFISFSFGTRSQVWLCFNKVISSFIAFIQLEFSATYSNVSGSFTFFFFCNYYINVPEIYLSYSFGSFKLKFRSSWFYFIWFFVYNRALVNTCLSRTLRLIMLDIIIPSIIRIFKFFFAQVNFNNSFLYLVFNFF